MNHVRIAIISVLTVALLSPVTVQAESFQSPSHSYNLSNYYLTVDGNNVVISYGGNLLLENWQYYVSNNNSSEIYQHLSDINVNVSNNGQFVVMSITMSNRMIRAYENYYVLNDTLGTSIVITNLFAGNITPLAVLDAQQFNNNPLSLINVNQSSIELQDSEFLIQNVSREPYLGATMGGYSIFWNQAAGLMGPAILKRSAQGNNIVLSMGEITLLENATESINLASQYSGVNLDNSPGQTPFPVSNSPSYIWNGNQIVSQIVQTAMGPLGPNTNAVAQYMWYSSSATGPYYVYQVVETISLTGTSTGESQTSYIYLVQDYFENHTNNVPSAMQTVVNLLIDVLNAFGIPLPNPYGLIPMSNPSPTSGTNTYTISHSGSYTAYDAYMCARFGLDCQPSYGAVSYHYGFLNLYTQTVDEFGFSAKIVNEYGIGGSVNNPAYNYYDYSVQYSIFESSNTHAIYVGSNNLYFNLAENV